MGENKIKRLNLLLDDFEARAIKVAEATSEVKELEDKIEKCSKTEIALLCITKWTPELEDLRNKLRDRKYLLDSARKNIFDAFSEM